MRRISLFITIWTMASLWMVFTAPEVKASCGSANCFLVTGTQDGIAVPGQIILDLSYRFIPMDQPQRGSKKVSEAFIPGIDFENGEIEPSHHRELRSNNELAQLDISVGVTERFSMTLAIPFFNLRPHEHTVIHGPGDEEFTRDDWTSGFGDLRLTGKYALWVSTRHLLVGGLGIKAPTGEYKLLNHDGKINEPTLMPGTGSWDGLVSAYYGYQIIPHRLDAFLSGSYQLTTENNLDYRFGNTLLVSGGLNHLFGEKRAVIGTLQVNARVAPHDEFKGAVVPSTGGKWVYLTPGIKVQASPNTALYAHLQLPLYQYVNEENLVPRYGFMMGVSHAF
ncbi:MAG: transporter [Candidatus Manganitrophaceae bacterium]|nr:MAG: transporter [Candidatus Manganitrophaceae bacterium]